MKKEIVALLALTFSTEAMAVNKVVYGEDSRVEVENSTNSNYVKWGKAVAARISKKALVPSGDSYSFKQRTLKDEMFLCSNERFQDQYAPADCSGFLVAPNLLVTAGHCVAPSVLGNEMTCQSGAWVFDYNNSEVKTGSIKKSNVYGCKRIINHSATKRNGTDYALIELNRPVEGVEPLKFRKSGSIRLGTPLAVIGSPSGLPLKVADGAFALAKARTRPLFITNLDSFGGNSGSPVINTVSGEVEGVLVRGAKDYVINRAQGCLEVNKCNDFPTINGGCYGESATAITAVNINKYLK